MTPSLISALLLDTIEPFMKNKVLQTQTIELLGLDDIFPILALPHPSCVLASLLLKAQAETEQRALLGWDDDLVRVHEGVSAFYAHVKALDLGDC
jgi:hypothetical protein